MSTRGSGSSGIETASGPCNDTRPHLMTWATLSRRKATFHGSCLPAEPGCQRISPAFSQRRCKGSNPLSRAGSPFPSVPRRSDGNKRIGLGLAGAHEASGQPQVDRAFSRIIQHAGDMGGRAR